MSRLSPEIKPARLRRLLHLAAMLKAGRRLTDYERLYGLSKNVVRDDRETLAGLGAEDLQRRLDAATAKPAAPKRRTCVYHVIRAGRVEACGLPAAGQYCEGHRAMVVPVPGVRSGLAGGRTAITGQRRVK